MSRIRSKNTSPELAVRRMLTQYKLRYRLHLSNLPGRPDIVFTKKKVAIFINGCFWHQHQNCKRTSMPKTNVLYWNEKLIGNVERQKKAIEDLGNLGWKPNIVWECQTKDKEQLNNILRSILNA